MSNSRIWVRRGGTLVSVIESPDRAQWTRRYQKLGTLEMSVRRTVDGAEFLVDSLGDEISITDSPGSTTPDLTFMIESLEFRQGPNGLGDEIVDVRAVEAGLFHMRIALPPPHELPLSGTDSHHVINGDAETAMRELVDNNVGPSAPTERQFPNLVIAANQNRGVSRKWQARFETIAEKLNSWCELSDLGFEVQYDAANDQHTFTVLEGSDHSAKVEFSVRLDNVESQAWVRNASDLLSFAWVAGQGEGTARDMDSTFTGITEPTGKDRRELFVDARDLETAADLPARGDEKLAERRLEESFEFNLAEAGPFSYKKDFDLGDSITVRNDVWGLEKTKRIDEVITRIEGDRTQRILTLGKPAKDIVNRVQEAVGSKGSARQ